MRQHANAANTRPRPTQIALALGAFAIALLALFSAAGPAKAEITHDFEGAFAENELYNPVGIAVDADAGDVFVLVDTLRKFDATGAPSNFSALGTNQLGPFSAVSSANQVAIDNSGGATDGRLYVSERPFAKGAVRAFLPSGEPSPFSHVAPNVSGNTITGTPSEEFAYLNGVAVDDEGTIYTAEYENGIHVFAPSGQYLTSIPIENEGVSTIAAMNIAVDSTGTVYAAMNTGAVWRFQPSSHPVTSSTTYSTTKLLSSNNTNRSVAVAPADDNLYVVEPGLITQYDSAANGNGRLGGFGGEELQNSAAGVAVNGAGEPTAVIWGRGLLYGPELIVPDTVTSPATGVDTTGNATLEGTVNPLGVELTECFFEYGPNATYGSTVPCAETPAEIGTGEAPVPVHADLTGLAPGNYHFRLVAVNGNGTSRGADQSFSSTAPPVVTETRAIPAFTEAELKARIDAGNAKTTYFFEYGPTAAYGSSTPERSLAASPGAVPVSDTITGLQQGGTYHFRLVATNSAGTYEGPDIAFTTLVRPGEEDCPNAALRAAQGVTQLGDCRAFEMVSPSFKAASDITVFDARSAPDGNSISYLSFGAFADAEAAAHADRYVAVRGAGGWTTRSITPPQPTLAAPFNANFGYSALTENLGKGVLLNIHPPDKPLSDESEDQRLLYMRNADGSYEQISPPAANYSPFALPRFVGASEDLTHVVFESDRHLLPTAPPEGTSTLYEWDEGDLRVVGVSPEGEAVQATTRDGFEPNTSISPDGSQIVFESGFPAQLYIRTDASTTVQISLSQKAGSVGEPAANGVAFAGTASADGEMISKVYFVSTSELTDDANTANGSNELYEYDVESGELRILTGGTDSEGGAGVNSVNNFWALPSADGSSVYFASSTSLTGDVGYAGTKLFRNVEGEVEYVGPISSLSEMPVLSTDGERAFYFSGAIDLGNGLSRAMLYDGETKTTTCVSCPAGGEPSFPAARKTVIAQYSYPLAYRQRTLSTDGERAFFMTEEALVPQDSNGKFDVYQWRDGALSLVSSGTSPTATFFVDASASGDDVFVGTRQRLSPEDRDSNIDLYDSRANSDLPVPAPPAPPCEGDACQTPPAILNDPTPASAGLQGNGNVPKQAAKKKQKKCKKQKSRCKKGGKKTSKNGRKASTRGNG